MENEPSARMVSHYLQKTVGKVSKDAVTAEIFNISQSIFLATGDNELSGNIETSDQRVIPVAPSPPNFDMSPVWTEFEFRTPLEGPDGPMLEDCVAMYRDTVPWIQFKNNLMMEKDGFQLLVIPTTGRYEITAYGSIRSKTTW